MYSYLSERAHFPILLTAILVGIIPWCPAQSPEAMATAHRWTAAKFFRRDLANAWRRALPLKEPFRYLTAENSLLFKAAAACLSQEISF